MLLLRDAYFTVEIAGVSLLLSPLATELFRPLHLLLLYGLPGLAYYIFGSRATWRTAANVLGGLVDDDAFSFKTFVQGECTMISVAAAIVAQIAITGLSFENLSRTHWTARASFLFSLVSSLMAVYYATTQQRIMARLLHPAQIRGWIRGKLPLSERGGISRLAKRRPASSRQSPTQGDPQNYQPEAQSLELIARELAARHFLPSAASVITISAPQMLLSSSLLSLLLGIGLYFGFTWTRALDSDSGPADSRNVMIVFLVSVFVCLAVYSICRVIQDEEDRLEGVIVFQNAKEFMLQHPELVAQWLASSTRQDRPDDAEESVSGTMPDSGESLQEN